MVLSKTYTSLRFRLGLAFMVLALGPLLVAGLAQGWYNFEEDLLDAYRLEEQVAARVAGQIQALLGHFEQELRSVTRFRNFSGLPAAEQRRLLEELSNQQVFQEIAFVDASGREQSRVSRLHMVVPGAPADHGASEAFRIPAATGKPYFGPVNFDEASGEPLLTLALPLPDVYSGKTAGVLIAQARFKPVWELIARLELGPGEAVYLLDGRKRVVAHRNPSVVLRKTRFEARAGPFVQTGLEGTPGVLATRTLTLGEQEFCVMAELGAAQALLPAFHGLLIAGAITLLALLLASVLIWLALRQVVRPIRLLSRSVKRVRDGDLASRAEIASRDEIGELAAAFNSMTSRLQENMRVLERQIAERWAAEDALRAQQELLQNILESIPQYVFWKDRASVYLGCNQNFAELVGVGDPARIVGKTDYDLPWRAEDTEFYRKIDREVMDGGAPRLNLEEPLRSLDGSLRTILTSKTPLRDARGAVIGLLGVFTDITERKRAEVRLRQLSLAVEQSPASVMITDTAGIIQYVNPKFEEVSGYSAQEAVGQKAGILRSGNTPSGYYRELWETVLAGREWRGEFQNRRKNGQEFWEYASISPIKDTAGRITHILAVKEDITLRKAYEEKLLHQANYDALTGLPNRVLALDRLHQVLAMAHRRNAIVGLLFIDLDQFKHVNDTLGHHLGDELLREAGRRFLACVREEDTVARLGGDEFMVILAELRSIVDTEIVAKKILAAFAQAFDIGGHEIFVTASVGITVFPDDGEHPHVLMQNADAAMYQAKESGRNNFRFFTPELNRRIQKRVQLETQLRHALERGEFVLYYQPLLDLHARRVGGAEALLRWESPALGRVSPEDFIQIAEDAGLIVPIGEWVLENACRQVAAWRRQGLELARVAVNVSSRQFRGGAVLAAVMRALDASGLPPRCLELEITERLLMADLPETTSTLQELRGLGVTLSIDDFGTGYSSLSYLKRFPVTTLKIDKSFIRDIGSDPDDAALVAAILSMARSLKLEVIAEGVENREQLSFLHARGCDLAQGYYFSKPLSAAEFGAAHARLQQSGAVLG